jgi:hypothetical protein
MEITGLRGFAIWREDLAGWPPHCASINATMAPIFVAKGAAKGAAKGGYGWARRLGRRSPSARVYASELRVRLTGDFDFMNAAIRASADPRGCASKPKPPPLGPVRMAGQFAASRAHSPMA